MIFFYDSNGGLIKQSTEEVNQSSHLANTIVFVMPTSPTNEVDIAFNLPNGQWTQPYLMSNITDGVGLVNNGEKISDQSGNVCGIYEFNVPQALTTYAGKVLLQFRVHADDGGILATDTVEFTVLKGVPSYNRPAPQDVYQQILTALGGVNLTLTNLETEISRVDSELNKKINDLDTELKESVTELSDNLAQELTNLDVKVTVEIETFKGDITKQVADFKASVGEQFNELDKSINEQVTRNTNEIKALYGLNITKGVLAYDNAQSIERVQQTGGTALAGLNILDGSYATVNKIQGKTVKCENLFDISKIPTTEALGLTNNGDGSLTIGNFPTYAPMAVKLKTVCPSLKVGDIVCFSLTSISETKAIYIQNGNLNWRNNTAITITQDMLDSRIGFYCARVDGVNQPTTISDIMINYGETALPYEPYFDGLKNAQISGIKSVSNLCKLKGRTVQNFGAFENTTVRNIKEDAIYLGCATTNYYVADSVENFSITNGTMTGTMKNTWYGIGIPVRVVGGEKYHLSCKISSTSGHRVVGCWYDKSGNLLSGSVANGMVTAPSNAYWAMIIFDANGNAGSTITISDITLVYGTTSVGLREYEESLLTLPETLELGEWDNITGKTLTKGTSEILTLTGYEKMRQSLNDEGWSNAELNKSNSHYVKINYMPPQTVELKSMETPVVNNPYVGLISWYWGAGAGENGNGDGVYVNDFVEANVCQVGVQLSKQTLGLDALDSNGFPIEYTTEQLTNIMLAYIQTHPIVLVSKLKYPTITEIENDGYLVWDKGQETVLTPTDDSGKTCFDYGANTTIDRNYYVLVGGK